MGVARYDLVADATVDAARLTALAGGPAILDEALFVLRELNADGTLGAETPFQIDFQTPNETAECVRLRFLLSGETQPTVPRRYQLARRLVSHEVPLHVRADLTAYDAGQAAFRITTPAADYFYQLSGAGFSSLHDPDGNDWISYRPGDGPLGEFRGIPNMGHPDNYMHPGGTLSTTRLESAGPLAVVLYSESKDGLWAGRWEIYPTYAVMTVLKTSRPCWFLYEGTPGGSIEPDADSWIRADGTTGTLRETWRDHPMAADWVAFADGATERSLLLVHEVNQSQDNSYWLMKDAMTVFGFGRRSIKEKTIAEFPRRFYVVLTGTKQYDRLAALAASFSAPLEVRAE
jgi:hypothetical protein